MSLRLVMIAALVFGLSLAAGIAARRWQPKPAVRETATRPIDRGAVLFTLHCAKCHGDSGRGDAEGAENLNPPPRNFASRPWRYEATSGSIRRVIDDGIPGTSMPAFAATLLEVDREALTQHVLSLATQTTNSQAQDPFVDAGYRPLATPRPAPSLKLDGPGGQQLDLSHWRGKVVLLNFWGVSCEHCLARMPQLAAFERSFAERDFVIVNICADESDIEAAAKTITDVESSLTTFVDASGLATSRYEVSLMPTLWLVDREGRLLAKAQGAQNWQSPHLKALIESLLTPQN